jgi:hypothetical protein
VYVTRSSAGATCSVAESRRAEWWAPAASVANSRTKRSTASAERALPAVLGAPWKALQLIGELRKRLRVDVHVSLRRESPVSPDVWTGITTTSLD